MLTATEQSLCEVRPNTIDHAATAALHRLGHYRRRLPVNLDRMMENAYDWEHLPFVHATSFSSIELIAQGDWGWRAKTGLIPDTDYQVIDLLVDREKHYWATTVFSGKGQGLQIHTQATAVNTQEIDIDVRFYLPSAPPEGQGAGYLQALQKLYSQLYDEDLGLMQGRQNALDGRKARVDSRSDQKSLLVGDADEIAKKGQVTVEGPGGKFCVRRVGEDWVVHGATCPHQLGPLDEAALDADGNLSCPWHGYRFDPRTGENLDGKCRNLPASPQTDEIEGVLFLRFQ